MGAAAGRHAYLGAVLILAAATHLRTSRARVLEVGNRERRRLAHDLHDVLQSRLTLAAMYAGRLAADPDSGLRPELMALRDQLDVEKTPGRISVDSAARAGVGNGRSRSRSPFISDRLAAAAGFGRCELRKVGTRAR